MPWCSLMTDCIFGNDHEVSCRGQLFNGSSFVPHVQLEESERLTIEHILSEIRREFVGEDRYHEEALRSWLRLYHTSNESESKTWREPYREGYGPRASALVYQSY